jgi:glycosyltransferase involved in cell wall biosynthesis
LIANAFRKARRTLLVGRREARTSSEPLSLAPLAETPLVSVIIPCYNQGHFLTDAIESALAQTYPHVEIVVVDDGSTDTTTHIAGSYSHKKVRCIQQENQGLARARNRGLRESRGECLVFLDSDDRLRPRAIEVGVDTLKRSSGAAFCYGWSDYIAEDGTFLAPSSRRHAEGDHYLPLLRGQFIANPAAVMFRREAVEAVGGFRIGVNGVEDYDLCLRLARCYRVTASCEVVADYRQHDASLSRKIAVMSDSMRRVLHSQRAHVSGEPASQEALRQGLRKWRRGYYTEALVGRVRENARAGRWIRASADSVLLLRSNPRVLLENLMRKLKTVVARR